jgi:RNA-directed DNA polymerase
MQMGMIGSHRDWACFIPPPVRSVEIAKAGGGSRPGIPTAADGVVQVVLRQVPDTRLEPIFDQNSHSYRPDKSAHQAVENRRKRCRK